MDNALHHWGGSAVAGFQWGRNIEILREWTHPSLDNWSLVSTTVAWSRMPPPPPPLATPLITRHPPGSKFKSQWGRKLPEGVNKLLHASTFSGQRGIKLPKRVNKLPPGSTFSGQWGSLFPHVINKLPLGQHSWGNEAIRYAPWFNIFRTMGKQFTQRSQLVTPWVNILGQWGSKLLHEVNKLPLG